MVRLSFFSSCFMWLMAALYLAAVSLCSSSLRLFVCSASITFKCSRFTALQQRYCNLHFVITLPPFEYDIFFLLTNYIENIFADLLTSIEADCNKALHFLPSVWRGSASPARLSQSAACLPPAASVRPRRWSLWQHGEPQWLSGSLVLSFVPQAEPGQQQQSSMISVLQNIHTRTPCCGTSFPLGFLSLI